MRRLRSTGFGRGEFVVVLLCVLGALAVAAVAWEGSRVIERRVTTKVTERLKTEQQIMRGKDGRNGRPGVTRVVRLQVSEVRRCLRSPACSQPLRQLVRTTQQSGPRVTVPGRRGDDGARGQKGDKGAQGDQGPQGLPGRTTVIHQFDSDTLDGVDNRLTDAERIIATLTQQIAGLTQKLSGVLNTLCQRLRLCLPPP